MSGVTLETLRSLFTGEWAYDLECWNVTPCYSDTLALVIAVETKPKNEAQLRQALYGATPNDEVPMAAQRAITIAFGRYQSGQ